MCGWAPRLCLPLHSLVINDSRASHRGRAVDTTVASRPQTKAMITQNVKYPCTPRCKQTGSFSSCFKLGAALQAQRAASAMRTLENTPAGSASTGQTTMRRMARPQPTHNIVFFALSIASGESAPEAGGARAGWLSAGIMPSHIFPRARGERMVANETTRIVGNCTRQQRSARPGSLFATASSGTSQGCLPSRASLTSQGGMGRGILVHSGDLTGGLPVCGTGVEGGSETGKPISARCMRSAMLLAILGASAPCSVPAESGAGCHTRPGRAGTRAEQLAALAGGLP